ncbi:hypothetical protein ACWCSD_24820 [Nonomuraea sp. NPDC001684]
MRVPVRAFQSVGVSLNGSLTTSTLPSGLNVGRSAPDAMGLPIRVQVRGSHSW